MKNKRFIADCKNVPRSEDYSTLICLNLESGLENDILNALEKTCSWRASMDHESFRQLNQ